MDRQVDRSQSNDDFYFRCIARNLIRAGSGIRLCASRLLSLSKSNTLLAQQRGKFTSKVHADFRKIFTQNLEYLAALWSDLDEKLSSWS